MKTIGQVLLWVGFLSGSLATVYYAPSEGVGFMKAMTSDEALEKDFELPDLQGVVVPEEGWHLIPWVWYGISVAICVVGIVVLTKAASPEQHVEQGSKLSLADLSTRLTQLISNLEEMIGSIDQLAPSQITARIDAQLADDFREFADSRNLITTEYGLDVFADVMTQFASGERSVNRAWSAAADGYIDEAEACLKRGKDLLQEAHRLLNDAAKN
ncbi:hypothetical protein N9V88_02455 [bacterium]|jgi:hypothetical protein|nr:hypothetical protein [bacterium]